jgi:hypothetical protein
VTDETVPCNLCGDDVPREDAEWVDGPEADIDVDEDGEVEDYGGTTGYVHRHAFCDSDCKRQYVTSITRDGVQGAYSNEPLEVVPEEEVEE